ncbi:MAG TPA: hypothetical protein GX399_03695 [Xanthomonadaceae bacterium]|nr:hypothetical protein [Xanthomonadaceae bacterium]
MNPEELASLTLEHLRHIRARVDQTAADVDIIKHRLTSLQGQTASVHSDMAIIHLRIDKVDSRLDHIERRLELSDAPN